MENESQQTAGKNVDDAQSLMNRTNISALSQMTNLNAVSSLLQIYSNDKNQDDLDDSWNAAYTLRHSMLPTSYISAEQAQKILFIGKAIMILQSPRTPIQERIPQNELQAFSEALCHLQQQVELNPVLLCKVIEEIRECVANRLWHLIVVQSQLVNNLIAAKDYFLLGKGEFFQLFIEESRELMMLAP